MQRHIHPHTRRNMNQPRIVKPRKPSRRHRPQHLRKISHEAPRHVRRTARDTQRQAPDRVLGVRVRRAGQFGPRAGSEGFDGGVEAGEV